MTTKSSLICSNGGIIEPQKSGQEYKTPGTAKTLEGQGGGAAGGTGGGMPSDTKPVPNTGLGGSAAMLAKAAANPGTTPEQTAQANYLKANYDVMADLSSLQISFPADSGIKILHQPLLYEQNKTHWCYATSAYIMCEKCILDIVNRNIQKFADDMVTGIINELAEPKPDINENGKYLNTEKGIGTYGDGDAVGVRKISNKAGKNLEIAGILIKTENPSIPYYFFHPIQSYIVNEVMKSPKSNKQGSISTAILNLTGKMPSYSYVEKEIEKDGKKVIDKDFSSFEDWLDASGNVNMAYLKEFLIDKLQFGYVAASVASKLYDAEKKKYVPNPQSSHSIVIKGLDYSGESSKYPQGSYEYYLNANIIYIDTLDGLEEDSNLKFTIKDAFIDGHDNFRSVSGKIYLYNTIFFTS